MATFSRALGRRGPLRVATAALGLAWAGVFAAYAYGVVYSTPSTSSIVAAVAAFLIAGAGILYAWREPGR